LLHGITFQRYLLCQGAGFDVIFSPFFFSFWDWLWFSVALFLCPVFRIFLCAPDGLSCSAALFYLYATLTFCYLYGCGFIDSLITNQR
jgi:hypothetical protein